MKINLISVLLPMLLISCGKTHEPLMTVDYVDLSRYTGKWYEIARKPNRFQKDCLCSTAEYSIIDNRTIRVVNKCLEKDGKTISSVKGKAFVVANSNNAKLKVQFFWPFKGDYWIINLDKENYSYAVVGSPSRKYFWILARSPEISDEKLNELLEFLKSNKFDINDVIISKENCLKSKF